MDDLAEATVGTQGNGLNQEQRKRLTIGVELASKPELLIFLDEVSCPITKYRKSLGLQVNSSQHQVLTRMRHSMWFDS